MLLMAMRLMMNRIEMIKNFFKKYLSLCLGSLLVGGTLFGAESQGFVIKSDESLSGRFLEVLAMDFQDEMHARLKFVVAKEKDKNDKKELCQFDAVLLSEATMKKVPKNALSLQEILFESAKDKTNYVFSMIEPKYCARAKRKDISKLKDWFKNKALGLIEGYKVNYQTPYIIHKHK
ncbi:hypothetical protein [Helicobacter cetorum]|uniref:hypothetical protein n=1 Tax=Helicobacter cetorum TaxID=138563 RepID=UPI0013155F4E|nr:hypothetical protein [Helicobacter cetorum]